MRRALVAWILWVPAAWAQLNVQLTSPQRPVADQMVVAVTVDSPFPITQLDVTFNGQTSSVPNGTTFDTSALAYGLYPLSVVAHDSYGQTGTASTTVSVDRPPRLVVREPIPQQFVANMLPAVIDCFDDSPDGCSGITATVQNAPCGGRTCPTTTYAQASAGGAHLETILDVSSAQTGRGSILLARGTDGQNQPATVEVPLVVDHDPHLVPVLTEPGLLLDYDGERALFVNDAGFAEVHHLAGGTREVLEGVSPLGGALIEGGALVSTVSATYELRPSGSQVLDPSRSLWRAGGRRVATTGPSGWVLYELGDAGAPAPIASGPAAYPVEVAPNGEAVYVTANPDGGTTVLVNFTSGAPSIELSQSPNTLRSDGTMVVTFDSARGYGVYAPGTAPVFIGGSEPYGYQVTGGLVALDQGGQAFVREQDGGFTRRTSFSSGALLVALGPNGDLMVLDGSFFELHLVPAGGGSPVTVSGIRDSSPLFVNGAWRLLLGNAVLWVDPSIVLPPPDGGGQPPPFGQPPCGCSEGSGLTALAAALLAAVVATRRARRSPAPASAPAPAPGPGPG